MNKVLIVVCVIAAAVAGYVLFVSNSAGAPSTKDETAKTSQSTTKSQTTTNPTNEKKSMELEIKTTQEGTGQAVKEGDTVSVLYTGKLLDGTVFDASSKHGNTPFEFEVGAGMVIKGWDQGLLGAKVGEKRTLTIPSDLGYGAQGAGASIPPNSTLIFDIEVLAVR